MKTLFVIPDIEDCLFRNCKGILNQDNTNPNNCLELENLDIQNNFQHCLDLILNLYPVQQLPKRTSTLQWDLV